MGSRLSVMNVFSLYSWLRPLEKKASHHVMQNMVHQIAFKATVDRSLKEKLDLFCKALKIKLIKSRPYHPQSKGKVKRSHRQLRKKIMCDLVTLGKKGVNWAANLDDYNRILNNECNEELGWKTPFEIYYGRKSNL